MKMSSKVYDVLKYIALIVLPALATLYAVLAEIWTLPFPQAIPATIMAVDTFLGALLKLSSDKYYKDIVNELDPPTEDGEEG